MILNFEDIWNYICYGYSSLSDVEEKAIKDAKFGRNLKEAFCKFANKAYQELAESKFGLDLDYINSNKDDVYEVYADDSEMFDSMEFSIKNTNIRMIYGIDACRWFDIVLDENNSCAEPIYYLNIDTDDTDYNELAKALFMCFPNWTFPDSEIYVEFLVTPLELTEADKAAFNKIYNTVEDKSVGFVCFAKDDTFYSFNKANSIIKES